MGKQGKLFIRTSQCFLIQAMLHVAWSQSVNTTRAPADSLTAGASNATKGICHDRRTSIFQTECKPCSVSTRVQCTDGATKLTSGTGDLDCTYVMRQQRRGRWQVRRMPGCRHTCQRVQQIPKCCPGYWGQDCQGTNQLFPQFSPNW